MGERDMNFLCTGGKPPPLNAKDRVRLERIRERLQWALDDLTFAANNLPENQLRQVFTVDKLEPLLNAIITPSKGLYLRFEEGQYLHRFKIKGRTDVATQEERKDWEGRRQRIVKICKPLLNQMCLEANYLAPESFKVLETFENQIEAGWKAMWIGH
jgi:hypothetical protein